MTTQGDGVVAKRSNQRKMKKGTKTRAKIKRSKLY
jgi:hypothetical protein